MRNSGYFEPSDDVFQRLLGKKALSLNPLVSLLCLAFQRQFAQAAICTPRASRYERAGSPPR
jgi:hypothetical protein